MRSMINPKREAQIYKGGCMKSWTDLMEEATELHKKNAGLLADRYRIYRATVNALNNLEKIVPIEPRAEYHVDSATDELMKVVGICIPTENDIPY